NIGGAGGNIGTTRAAQSPADGHTILVNGSNHIINPSLYEQIAYDAFRDFAPVALVATSPVVLTVHPSVPARTVDELITLIRAHSPPPRPGPARLRILSASSFASRSISTLSTFRTRVAVKPSVRQLPGKHLSALSQWPLPFRRLSAEHCARLRLRRKRDHRR